MNRLAAVVVALMLWCGSALALGNGPGGGGVFTCSAINGFGGQIAGSDNGGLYYRTNPNGTNWTRVGSFHGILSNAIYSVCFGSNPTWAAMGGDGALAMTTTFGSSRTWTAITSFKDTASTPNTVTITSDMHFPAIAFGTGADSSRIWVAAEIDTGNYILESNDIKTNNPPTFTMMPSRNLYWSNAVKSHTPPTLGRITKIAQDANTVGSSGVDIYVLFGKDGSADGAHELWRTSDVQSNSTNFAKISGVNSGPSEPLDFAILPRGPGYPTWLVVSSTSDGSNTAGKMWHYEPNASPSPLWTRTKSCNEDTDPDILTGAVYAMRTAVLGTTREFVQVMRDVGEAVSGGSTCPSSSGGKAKAGLWMRPVGTDSAGSSGQTPAVWRRVSKDQTDSQVGYLTCSYARGVFSGVAKSLSRVNDVTGCPVQGTWGGPMWGGSYMLSDYDSTGTGDDGGFYKMANTSADIATDRHSTNLDNANAAVLSEAPDGKLWAGYYDIGLWKYVGGTYGDWQQKGGSNGGTELWGGTDGTHDYGGSVNGIAWADWATSDTVLVTEATSTGRPDPNNLWRSISGGARWTSVRRWTRS